MSALTLWARPTWEIDRWIKDGVLNGFTPAAEVVKDGDDAVVRIELPGVDVAKDVNVEVDRGHLVIHGERRDERAEQKDGRTLREAPGDVELPSHRLMLRAALMHLQRMHRARLAMDQGAAAAEAIKTLRPPVFFRRTASFTRALSLWSSAGLGAAMAGLSEA